MYSVNNYGCYPIDTERSIPVLEERKYGDVSNEPENVTTTHQYGNERQEEDSSTMSLSEPVEQAIRKEKPFALNSYDYFLKATTEDIIQEIK